MKSLKLKQSNVVGFSRDGRSCFTLARDVNLWDIDKRKKLWKSHPFSHPSDAAFSPNGKLLAVKNTLGCIVTLATETGNVVYDYSVKKEREGCNIQFSECGQFLVDGSWDGKLIVRGIDSGSIVHCVAFEGEMICHVQSACDGSIWIVQHAPKATDRDRPPANGYFTIHSGSIPNGTFSRLGIHFPFIRSSAMSADGARLAVLFGAPPNSLHVYEFPSEKLIWEDEVEIGGAGASLCWSNSGCYLASVQREGMVHYEGATGKRIKDFPMTYPSDVDYSPDEQLMVLGAWESGKIISL